MEFRYALVKENVTGTLRQVFLVPENVRTIRCGPFSGLPPPVVVRYLKVNYLLLNSLVLIAIGNVGQLTSDCRIAYHPSTVSLESQMLRMSRLCFFSCVYFHLLWWSPFLPTSSYPPSKGAPFICRGNVV